MKLVLFSWYIKEAKVLYSICLWYKLSIAKNRFSNLNTGLNLYLLKDISGGFIYRFHIWCFHNNSWLLRDTGAENYHISIYESQKPASQHIFHYDDLFESDMVAIVVRIEGDLMHKTDFIRRCLAGFDKSGSEKLI